jgi:drug/metabolite transporter (DMT)-like permease
MTNQAKGIFFTLITILMWGVLAIALKVASRVMDSPTIVWFRFSLAFSGMFVWMVIRNPAELKILYKPSWLIVISSLALAWNYIGFMLGVQYTTPSNAQVAVQAGPVILAVLSVIFFKEKISLIQGLGFLLAIIGFWIFYRARGTIHQRYADYVFGCGSLVGLCGLAEKTGFSLFGRYA